MSSSIYPSPIYILKLNFPIDTCGERPSSDKWEASTKTLRLSEFEFDTLQHVSILRIASVDKLITASPLADTWSNHRKPVLTT